MKTEKINCIAARVLILFLLIMTGCASPTGGDGNDDPAAAKYTVTYNDNGATSGMVPTDSGAYPENTIVTVLGNTGALARSGYAFTGWTDGNGTSYLPDATFTMGTADVILYATWSQNFHTLSFDANGGSGTMADQTVAEGATVTLPGNTFTRTYYTFTGWTDGNGTSYLPDATFTMGTADVILYATWSQNFHTLSFDNNGGSGTMADQTVAEGAAVTLPGNTFTRSDYDFAGWATTSSGSVEYADGETFTMGTADLPLYAVWKKQGYTVTYNANGATGGSVPSAVTGYLITASDNSGSLVKIPEAGTAEAFKFAGWNTLANGYGTTYQPGDSFTITENIILYVQWGAFETGDIGPAGGHIFYDKGSFSSGWRYMEAAPASGGTKWTKWAATYTNQLSTSSDIGKGKANTATIVAALDASGETDYAAKFCDSLSLTSGGVTYDDWFMPSMDELREMYRSLGSKSIGGFGTVKYWSSTDYYYKQAYILDFMDGHETEYEKKFSINVRAVRWF